MPWTWWPLQAVQTCPSMSKLYLKMSWFDLHQVTQKISDQIPQSEVTSGLSWLLVCSGFAHFVDDIKDEPLERRYALDKELTWHHQMCCYAKFSNGSHVKHSQLPVSFSTLPMIKPDQTCTSSRLVQTMFTVPLRIWPSEWALRGGRGLERWRAMAPSHKERYRLYNTI